MVRTIYLHGALGEQFGREHRLDVRSAAEAVRAFMIMLPGFRKAFRGDGYYRIVRGDLDNGTHVGPEGLQFGLGAAPSLHIIPELSGSKNNGGTIKIIIGVIIIAAAIYFSGGLAAPTVGEFGAAMGATSALGVTYGAIAMFGVTVALSGVAQLMAQTPTVKGADLTGRESPDQRASFLFNGPVNTIEQGASIPLCYGRVVTGSVVISASIRAEEIA